MFCLPFQKLCNMTEQRIFDIILKDHKTEEKHFDFPSLQEEAVDIITKDFTDIIYETLKQKSSASGIKRGNILKFINSVCAVKPCHFSKDSYKFDLKVVKNSFKSSEREDVDRFVNKLTNELEKLVSNDLTQNVVEFYEKKHSIQKEKIKQLEFIKRMDQEKLDSKFNIHVTRNFVYYETNKNLIMSLLGETSCIDSKNQAAKTDCDYREKQIKLGYAISNLNNSEDMFIIERILERLSKCKVLSDIEQNFVQYVFDLQGDTINLVNTVAEKFPFVLERLILRYCTQVLSINDSGSVCQYFLDLENNGQFRKLRKICENDPQIYHKLKSLIFHLYCFSFCNENVLKFSDFIL